MNVKKVVFTCLILLILPSVLILGSGKRDPGDSDLITITGRIKVKGSEPHTSVTLITEEGINYILVGEKSLEISEKYQLKMLEVEARLLRSGDTLLPSELEVLSFKILQ